MFYNIMVKLLVILGLVVVVSSQDNSVFLPQCAASDHCPADRACIGQKCEDPCVGVCGNNTSCAVRFHIPSCACLPGYTGNPFVACIPQEPTVCRTSQPTSGRKKFVVELVEVNWFAAFTYCASHGGRLATVESKEDNDMIIEEINKLQLRDSFWLSGTSYAAGQWVWMTTGKPLSSFTDWRQGEPNNIKGTENCLEFDSKTNGGPKWNDANCFLGMFPICEYVQ